MKKGDYIQFTYNGGLVVAIFDQILKDGRMVTYCCIDSSKGDRFPRCHFYKYSELNDIKPAEPSMKALIDQSLESVNRKWDPVLNEEVPIWWEPAYGETYYFPSFDGVKFKPIRTVNLCSLHDVAMKHKGWCLKDDSACESFCSRLNKLIDIKP